MSTEFIHVTKPKMKNSIPIMAIGLMIVFLTGVVGLVIAIAIVYQILMNWDLVKAQTAEKLRHMKIGLVA